MLSSCSGEQIYWLCLLSNRFSWSIIRTTNNGDFPLCFESVISDMTMSATFSGASHNSWTVSFIPVYWFLWYKMTMVWTDFLLWYEITIVCNYQILRWDIFKRSFILKPTMYEGGTIALNSGIVKRNGRTLCPVTRCVCWVGCQSEHQGYPSSFLQIYESP